MKFAKGDQVQVKLGCEQSLSEIDAPEELVGQVGIVDRWDDEGQVLVKFGDPIDDEWWVRPSDLDLLTKADEMLTAPEAETAFAIGDKIRIEIPGHILNGINGKIQEVGSMTYIVVFDDYTDAMVESGEYPNGTGELCAGALTKI